MRILKADEHSREVGLSFGLTSAVITTLGLIVGLNASTNSATTVLGGIMIIAIADAFSDALGIHMSEESEGVHTAKEIWVSTFFTFLSKFSFALTFAVPVLLVPAIIDLQAAIIADIIWGFLLLAIFSYRMAKRLNGSAAHVVAEHLGVAVVVVLLTQYIGAFIRSFAGSLL